MTVSPHISDSGEDFITAVSMLASLEGLCAAGGTGVVVTLPFLGMARSELTSYGLRVPPHLEAVEINSLADGIADLGRLLSRMVVCSRDLAVTLRLQACRELLREGTEPYAAERVLTSPGSWGTDPGAAGVDGCTLPVDCRVMTRQNGEVPGCP